MCGEHENINNTADSELFNRSARGKHLKIIQDLKIWDIFDSHVTSLTLTSRLPLRTNVSGRGPPSSNKCRIWHGAGLSSTKTSERKNTFKVTYMRPKTIAWLRHIYLLKWRLFGSQTDSWLLQLYSDVTAHLRTIWCRRGSDITAEKQRWVEK